MQVQAPPVHPRAPHPWSLGKNICGICTGSGFQPGLAHRGRGVESFLVIRPQVKFSRQAGQFPADGSHAGSGKERCRMKPSTTMKPSCLAPVLVSLVLGTVLGRTGVSLAAEDTWTSKADMPTARGFVSGCVADGKIYVVGGTDNTQLSAVALVEVYDPVSDTWTTRASMPEARTCPATCTYNGKVNVF
jgi:hypothetical protein